MLAKVFQRTSFARFLSALLVLTIWMSLIVVYESALVPTPAAIIHEMIGFVAAGDFAREFAISLRRFLVGFAIASVVGLFVGVAIGLSRHADAAFRDFVVIGLTFPDLIWAVLIAMWIGFGNTGPVLVMVLAAVPYVAINVAAGVRDTPVDLVRMATAFGVPRRQLFRHVMLPAFMPHSFAALRYVVATGWPALIGAEVFTAQSGAGYFLVLLRRTSTTAPMIAWGVFFVIFAVGIERLVFMRASRHLFRWRPL